MLLVAPDDSTDNATRDSPRMFRRLIGRFPSLANKEIHWWLARFSVFILVVVLAFLLSSVLTENSRINDANREQDSQLDTVFRGIRLQITAECPFRRIVYLLPDAARQQSQVIWNLSDSSRDAYNGAHCPVAINPQTHKPFGKLPTLKIKRDDQFK